MTDGCRIPCEVLKRVVKQLDGNGVPGIVQDVQSIRLEAQEFYTRHDTWEKAQKEFHEKRDQEIKDALTARGDKENRHYRLVTILLSLISVLLAVRALWHW